VPDDPALPPLPPVAGDPPVSEDPPLPLVAVDPPLPIVPPVPEVPPVPVVTLATHLPLAQCCVAAQAVPQPPQFVPLVVVSTQLDPQSVRLVSQLEVQLPLLQTWPDWQVVAQLPQWVASDGTHEPLQDISPDWHWHAPFWQTCPDEQGMPQPPQFVGSDEVSMQSVPQVISVPGQVVTLLPPLPGVPPAPAVPPLPFEQASARNARPSAKTRAKTRTKTATKDGTENRKRAVVILTPIPNRAESDRRPARREAYGTGMLNETA
jgi:hypothetical protein